MLKLLVPVKSNKNAIVYSVNRIGSRKTKKSVKRNSTKRMLMKGRRRLQMLNVLKENDVLRSKQPKKNDVVKLRRMFRLKKRRTLKSVPKRMKSRESSKMMNTGRLERQTSAPV
jgi:hypothetical protein